MNFKELSIRQLEQSKSLYGDALNQAYNLERFMTEHGILVRTELGAVISKLEKKIVEYDKRIKDVIKNYK